ncbi:MAG: Ig-like domain-containing protein, partial [Firmicutes bacterium]|nr:Ig-like domain-containing protein [Bacillota bacterium]
STITGTLSFAGLEPITVTAKLHVIANVIAMRNVSTVTMAGYAPTLPSTVNGVLADGTVTGEFAVTWDSVSADDFANVDEILTVSGTATVIGTATLPVTCTVRVAEAVNTESTNVAADYYTLTEDCTSTSDNLNSIVDGVTNNSSDTTARWTNYNNRNNSSTATITFTWSTAQLLSGVNLYFFTDSFSAALPSDVSFAYSLDGTTFTEITYADVTPTTGFTETAYVFDSVINPIALRITLTEQSGHCVGLTECEIMTYAGSVTSNPSAALSGIYVDGTAVSGFDADTLAYTAEVASDAEVTAETAVNAGITVLPIYTDNVVRILTISEDGSETRTYEVTLSGEEACKHTHTEIRNAYAATCTEDGYTGDLYCSDCGELLEVGSLIPATGHSTVTQNAKAATCTEDGYTGDEVCTVCGETVSTGTVIAATGHSWDSGTVTKAATTTEEGIMTYTCTVCGETRTEAIPKVEETKELLVPSVTLSVSQNSGKIRLTGTITDYENADDYYEVTGHGFVYITKAKLGAKSLTVNTSGRTKVTISGINSDGSYSYSMTPASASTAYVVRAWISYKNSSGKTVYVYSNALYVTYNGIAS